MTAARTKAEIAAAGIDRVALSIREFAAALGVNYHTIRRMCNRGELACTRIGSEMRIPKTELERLLADAFERRSA
jgi:excisionase family DNA binding protein